ncbi:calcium-binding EGF domain protein [Gregarina niphandrodes]|uniref:Calcium-binding EGF domain protein n=1 Tax=Gregarina niphandrodes TaxID=110365 RepID=A0A023AY57_GRENI|nr:calcium-binding EGF domain protein [Gregarina niphandrodes]EZG43594.1 calcium-binding EGF domain protein [Gregarina niphandrodes]|eukprot:XP_011133172.1 calcium-binding EGF domain protein [Gregarina niphandrodes]
MCVAGEGVCGTREAQVECERVCARHNGRLQVGADGAASCSCAEGFEADAFAQTCVDVDECARGLDHCPRASSVCRNTAGGYYCECGAGFIPTFDGRGCERLNPCLAEPPPCGAGNCCRPQDGNYTCAAPATANLQVAGSNPADDQHVCPEDYLYQNARKFATTNGLATNGLATNGYGGWGHGPLARAKLLHGAAAAGPNGGLLTPQFWLDLVSLQHENLMNVLGPLFDSSIAPAIATLIASKALQPPPPRTPTDPRPRRATPSRLEPPSVGSGVTVETAATGASNSGGSSGGPNGSRQEKRVRHKKEDELEELVQQLFFDDSLLAHSFANLLEANSPLPEPTAGGLGPEVGSNTFSGPISNVPTGGRESLRGGGSDSRRRSDSNRRPPVPEHGGTGRREKTAQLPSEILALLREQEQYSSLGFAVQEYPGLAATEFGGYPAAEFGTDAEFHIFA